MHFCGLAYLHFLFNVDFVAVSSCPAGTSFVDNDEETLLDCCAGTVLGVKQCVPFCWGCLYCLAARLSQFF